MFSNNNGADTEEEDDNGNNASTGFNNRLLAQRGLIQMSKHNSNPDHFMVYWFTLNPLLMQSDVLPRPGNFQNRAIALKRRFYHECRYLQTTAAFPSLM